MVTFLESDLGEIGEQLDRSSLMLRRERACTMMASFMYTEDNVSREGRCAFRTESSVSSIQFNSVGQFFPKFRLKIISKAAGRFSSPGASRRLLTHVLFLHPYCPDPQNVTQYLKLQRSGLRAKGTIERDIYVW